MMSTIKTNCPRDCYDGCGILVEKRGDGRHRIVGDPDHPIAKGKLCSKCALAYNVGFSKTARNACCTR